ncbi:V-type ATP synthase subunit E [Ruminococcus flavefaciens]|uniref:V-type ATP synthase subunit E n=1 Tax=Ruminococcus flavefaciens TaxID=1265 RepID=UPI0026F29C58|nr:V-type ATP synthase subunit E family protein [Ruminococcus flavefaciens]MDD7515670.1 V-type ATP synthase subunit E family protein [Ruminococcus flavefaciens]MDY5690365.1 V-type ATP synthase subunit E family protein [Ruminococcus flavefaciens]
MAGLDDILNLIEAQQKQAEDSIMKAAASKARSIKADGAEKAQKAYEEHLAKAKAQAEKDFENSCASADAAMKRKLLACKVELIDETIEKTIKKLRSLPDKEYFELIIKLAERHIQPDNGIIALGKKDLSRVPSDFESKLNEAAKPKNGSIRLAEKAADIDDGFILSYGLISENCSFRAIIESEKDEIRDTAARALFR